MGDSVFTARAEYEDLGFDTLPLLAGDKICVLKGWQNRPSYSLWRNAPDNANIGIRCGGDLHLAVLDADNKGDPHTYHHLISFLASLGYMPEDYPVVQTASGVGRHIYITLTGILPNHYRHFSTEFGTGELRYGCGAYVAAPPSVVASRKYELLQGDLLHRPFLTPKDVLQILKIQDDIPKRIVNSAPYQKRIPRRTLLLLNGTGIERYASRSDAEQAILTGLVNKGFDFESALSFFMRYPCAGRFQEEYSRSPQEATKWLRRSYDAAVKFTSSNESRPRQLAQLAIELAKNRPWTGKTGQYDKVVYIAHASIAYRAGRLEYGVSARELSNMTTLSPEACMSATKRLCKCGFIIPVKSWSASLSNTYRLESQSLTLPHRGR